MPDSCRGETKKQKSNLVSLRTFNTPSRVVQNYNKRLQKKRCGKHIV